MPDRRLHAVVVALSLLAFAVPATAQDDPVIRGRKVSEWFKFIREEKDARRRLAALQLVDSEAGPKVAAVFTAMARELREHPDETLRARVAGLAPRYKERGAEVASALKSALAADKSPAVREACAAALGKLDEAGFTAVRELSDALKDASAPVRAAAAEALGRFSRIESGIARDAVPALVELLKDADRSVRLGAAFALGRADVGAVAPSAGALGSALFAEKDLAVKKELLRTLTTIGPKAADAAGPVLAALKDPSVEVRQLAAIALGKIAPDASAALPELLKATRDSDKSVRCHAIHAIGALKKAGVSAIPDLIEILKKDDVTEVRLAVIEELGGFGPDAKAALDVLAVAAKDGRPSIREAAQEAAKKIQQAP